MVGAVAVMERGKLVVEWTRRLFWFTGAVTLTALSGTGAVLGEQAGGSSSRPAWEGRPGRTVPSEAQTPRYYCRVAWTAHCVSSEDSRLPDLRSGRSARFGATEDEACSLATADADNAAGAACEEDESPPDIGSCSRHKVGDGPLLAEWRGGGRACLIP